mmetsp:Transcript_23849/g.68224  ORF Transcript_23849/g.68224 Transcript_23849/m.68224 type:complete len:205 (-) Transcript_23849:1-615(-)
MSFTSCIKQLIQCLASSLLFSSILCVLVSESARLCVLRACLASSAPILSMSSFTSFPRFFISSSRVSLSSLKPCSRLAFAFRNSSRNFSCSARMGSTSLCVSAFRSRRSRSKSSRHCCSSRRTLPTSSSRMCCSAWSAACSSLTSAFSALRTPHVPSNGFSLSTASVIEDGVISYEIGGSFAIRLARLGGGGEAWGLGCGGGGS